MTLHHLSTTRNAISSQSLVLRQYRFTSIEREKQLLKSHLETLESHLEVLQKELEKKNQQLEEVEYQCAATKSRATELLFGAETLGQERDGFEEVLLKLKFYVLGGAQAVRSYRLSGTPSLPTRLLKTLTSAEQDALDAVRGFEL
uniref:Uncharacterized protein n=1 Tax=Rhizochromulina marina TaxID=1034831 RepID=A0A7S2WTK3_9STRA